MTRQPPVQVVMVAGGSSLRHIRGGTVPVPSLTWRSEDPHATVTALRCRFYYCRLSLQVSGVMRPSSGV